VFGFYSAWGADAVATFYFRDFFWHVQFG
jgi:hypothetical protein